MAPLFTANQIADALSQEPGAVRKALASVKPSGVVIVRGKETCAWQFNDLAEQLRADLFAAASRQGYCSPIELLTAPPRAWQPPIPLAEIADTEIERANKLRTALLPYLMNQGNGAEFEAAGVREYARVFGHVITARYWRLLFRRTIERDGGAENFGRIELYLSDKPARKQSPAQIVYVALEEIQDQFPYIQDYIDGCSNPPNEEEQVGLWEEHIFVEYDRLVREGETPKRAARRLRDYLSRKAPFLARSRNALHRAFDLKLKRWIEEGRAPGCLRDRRKDNGVELEFPEDDRDKLVARAVFNYHGAVAPAWCDLLTDTSADGFSETTRRRYAGKAWRKSHVPASVMDDVGPEVEILIVMHQGPRAFDAIKGYVSRSYAGISSLQCMSADDFTLNSYFYVPDGKGWYTLTRGQTILFIDFRSLRILGYALEPRASYSSLTIRSLCTHVFAEFGLPEVLYFERGLWKRATLLKGKKDPFTFAQISSGLSEFGIIFKHAIRPRTKTVERIGGLFQSMAEAEPGYCGRDERHDAPESLRKQMAEVETRKVHPSKRFYSFEQWNKRIGEIVELYNATPQQGKILAGMSPDQAFEMFINRDDPPKQFSAGLRYLLAHEKRLARVTLNGVTIEVGKQRFNYRGKEIAHLVVGSEVLAWFDPENPEALVVTDTDRRNPICVARSQEPNALESLIMPGANTLSAELARIEGQASYIKTRFNVLKAKFELPARKALASAQAVELGQRIDFGKGELEGRIEAHRRNLGRAGRLAHNLGIVQPPQAIDGADPDAGKELRKFLKQSKSEAGTEMPAEPGNGKTYFIKSASTPQRAYVDYLIKRLTDFRAAGKSYGQQFAGEVSIHSTARIARATLKCDLYEPSKFEDVCQYLKSKIDATIQGKTNHAKGVPNYHAFEQEATI